MSKDSANDPLRPRDLALVLLASRELRPRQRARDQQADLVGLDLKRRLLEHIAALDPEPADLEAALLRIIEGLEKPSGPGGAIAASFREEWQAACVTPEWVQHLLAEAVEKPAEGKARE